MAMAMAMAGRALLLRSCRQLPQYPVSKIRSFSTLPGKIPASGFQIQVSLAHLLQRYGFPQSQLHRFIRENRRVLLDSSPSEVEECIRILLGLGLSQNSLVSALASCPRLLQLRFLRKWQSGSSIQRLLDESRVEPGDLRRSVEHGLRGLGLTDGTVVRVFDELPAGEKFRAAADIVGGAERRIQLLRRIGIEDDKEIDRVCYSFPRFLALSIDGWLRPLFREFGELGFGRGEVREVLLDEPRLLLSMEAGELCRCTDLLKSLKCRVPIRERILARGTLRACMLVKLRADLLCSYGLIRRDALKVLWAEPRAILYELGELEKKIQFLLHDVGLGAEWLVQFPEYLGMNLEKQIVPRHNVVKYLRLKGGLGFEVGLKHLVRYSRLRFYNLFVKPYPECEKMFHGGMVREVRAKSICGYPTGLWKLLKPQRYPDSKEDIRNIKSFMESLV